MKAATIGWPLFPAACVIATNLVLLAVPPPRPMRCFCETTEQIAHSTVVKYASEAWPEWQRAHPAATCPAKLGELNEWMNNKDIRDPWGPDYRMDCRIHSGVVSLRVTSAGPDQEHGNDDDIASDR